MDDLEISFHFNEDVIHFRSHMWIEGIKDLVQVGYEIFKEETGTFSDILFIQGEYALILLGRISILDISEKDMDKCMNIYQIHKNYLMNM